MARAPAKTTSPTIRARGSGRAALAEATAAKPSAEDNRAKLNGELDILVTRTAIANKAKNAGTTEEKNAKKSLNDLMNANRVTSHETMVEFPDGSKLPYTASISPGTSDSVDMRKLAAKCGVKFTGTKAELDMFFGMIGTSFKAVTDALGANAANELRVTTATLPALSVSQKK